MRYTCRTIEKANKIRLALFREYQAIRDYVDFIDVGYLDFLEWLGDDMKSKFEEDDGWVILNEENIEDLIQSLY